MILPSKKSKVVTIYRLLLKSVIIKICLAIHFSFLEGELVYTEEKKKNYL